MYHSPVFAHVMAIALSCRISHVLFGLHKGLNLGIQGRKHECWDCYVMLYVICSYKFQIPNFNPFDSFLFEKIVFLL